MFPDWKIFLSKQASAFISEGKVVREAVCAHIELALRKFSHDRVNIDIKMLSGEWEGFCRIRVGKIRMICQFDFKAKTVNIEAIDFRGNVYK